MNVKKIINNLVSKESKKINSVEFDITRELKDNYILKNITINDQDISLKLIIFLLLHKIYYKKLYKNYIKII